MDVMVRKLSDFFFYNNQIINAEIGVDLGRVVVMDVNGVSVCVCVCVCACVRACVCACVCVCVLSLIHISDPTRPERTSYVVFRWKQQILITYCTSFSLTV